ncbi:MAG: DUF2846 domain-containing protein [Arenimonas sp.]
MKVVLPLVAFAAFGLGISSLKAQEVTATAQEPVTAVEAATPVAEAVPAVEPAPAVAPQAIAVAELPKEITGMVGKPEPGKALVVFFRPSRGLGALIGFIVRENDVELGKLRNGNYFAVQVEPGAHTYVVHSEAKDVTAIEAEEGETYFVSGSITMGIMAGRPNLSPSTAGDFQAVMSKIKPSKPLK